MTAPRKVPPVYQKGPTWYAKLKYPLGHPDRPQGGWRNVATREGHQARALLLAEEMQARVDRFLPALQAHSTGPAALMTVGDLATRFLAEYHGPRISDLERYRARARLTLRYWILPHLGARPAAQLTRGEVRAWLAQLKARLAPQTCNAARRCLSVLFSWAVDLEILPVNPCARIASFPAAPAEDHLQAAEVSKLLHLDPAQLAPRLRRDWYRVALTLYTGLRIGESRALPWSCVDFEQNALVVAHNHSPGRKPKGGKVRVIPLHPALRALLLRWREDEGARGELVFPRRRKLAPPTTAPDSRAIGSLRQLSALAGVRVCAPRPWHALRHTFATALARVTAHEVVSRMLGHAGPGLQVTRLYIAPPDLGYLARELAKLDYTPPREPMAAAAAP